MVAGGLRQLLWNQLLKPLSSRLSDTLGTTGHQSKECVLSSGQWRQWSQRRVKCCNKNLLAITLVDRWNRLVFKYEQSTHQVVQKPQKVQHEVETETVCLQSRICPFWNLLDAVVKDNFYFEDKCSLLLFCIKLFQVLLHLKEKVFADKMTSFIQTIGDHCRLLEIKPITKCFFLQHPLCDSLATTHQMVGEYTFPLWQEIARESETGPSACVA